ncbi:MAG TPA: RDD family protein [Bacteroidia bacterium]|nr:RDD family protein [Bacteroidia bacterium]
MKIKKYHPQHPVLTSEEIILAGFWRRTAAMILDIIVILFLLRIAVKVLTFFGIQLEHVDFHNFHVEVKSDTLSDTAIRYIELGLTLLPTFYFALFTYFSNGKTIGKFIARIRVVSIYHHRISFWHCIERALGYAASTLEAGLGFSSNILEPKPYVPARQDCGDYCGERKNGN